MARKKTNDPLAGLPSWAQKLAQRYYTRTVSTFVVYGAVRDLQPVTRDDDTVEFANLKQFFSDDLFGGRDHVVFYDRSSGIRAAATETAAVRLSVAMSSFHAAPGARRMKTS